MTPPRKPRCGKNLEESKQTVNLLFGIIKFESLHHKPYAKSSGEKRSTARTLIGIKRKLFRIPHTEYDNFMPQFSPCYATREHTRNYIIYNISH